LAEIQQRLVAGLPPGAPLQSRADACALLRDDGPLSPEQRLEVYRRNIAGGKISALEAIFPVCVQVLGSRNFRALAWDYIWDRPAAGPDLNLYGEQMPGFLESRCAEHQGLRQLPYLADLARLEWLWHVACYAADANAFDFAAFAAASQASPESLQLEVSPDLGLLLSSYPVLEIWHRHRERGDTSEVAALERPEALCVHRHGLRPRVQVIGDAEYRMLRLCRAGATLEELVSIPLGHPRPAELLPQLIDRGWIVGFKARLDDRAAR
jgi:hypothetical protein